ncbi:hypothetical protein QBZ16_002082 [Prototheca wickerhamii]|uniref:Magnesium transporter n=1 Tax=Prototheca wickerhamii TaxID=3111 RepID=A0AAD9ING8_PROWI|nr:hypothetical protein QBZ16_002082 [Prototheca wickerhamii]
MGLDQGDGDGEVDPYSLQLFNTLWKESMRADGGETNNGSRVWLHVDDQGVPSEVEVDKHVLVYELGVRYRDLLTLDPTLPLPFPAAILIREQALVVNLENVRMIICANQCYILSVPSDRDPYKPAHPTADCQFVRKLFSPHYATSMPFELKALEVALGTVSAILEAEVFRLEHRGYPIVDKLTTDVSMPVLNGVREVKSSMNKLLTRVQRLKQELEDILDDDDDMADMYLARRAKEKGVELPPQPQNLCRGVCRPPRARRPGSSLRRPSDSGSVTSGSAPERGLARVSFQDQAAPDQRGDAAARREGGRTRAAGDDAASESGAESFTSEGPARDADARSSHSSGHERRQRGPRRARSHVDPHDIEDAEDQLENYYVKVDAILRRLMVLSEHIDANEDFVEIQMDHRRNELVALDLFVSVVAAVFGYVAMVGGFWGMNLYNTVWQESYNLFIATCVICGGGAIVMFGAFMYVILKRKLMFITDSV